MKWQHWLGWALLAVCVVVLGVYVFGDKPAEAQEVVREPVSCLLVGTQDKDGIYIQVPCPKWDQDREFIYVVIETPQGVWGAVATKR